MRFAGKLALITAAANGIGRATAAIMAREGATVIAVDNHQGRLDEALPALRHAGAKVQRKLAHELGPEGINVNAIAPSVTLTERIRPHWEKRSRASQAEEIERTPLRRVAEAVDQANVICFLASPDADFVTGLTIDVTGGV